MTIRKTTIFLILAASLFGSCKTSKYAAAEKIYRNKTKEYSRTIAETAPRGQIKKLLLPGVEWIPSTNFGIRKPNYVMLHHTAQNSIEQTVKTFQLERTGVSSHYVIGRNGQVVQMVNDYLRTHHAGSGRWGNDTDLNSSSIGIELDNNGTTDPWPEQQISALIVLLNQLKDKYKIPQANFIGHLDFAPSRKIDPYKFPWDRLAESGFGYWYTESELAPVPFGFDTRVALRTIGYDVRNLSAAIKGFKRHYIQSNMDDSDTLSDRELSILYAIMLKYM